MTRRQSHRQPVTPEPLTENLRELWELHRYLSSHRPHPNLRAQHYRTRAAVMAAIAELTATVDALSTAPGAVNLDRELTDNGDHL